MTTTEKQINDLFDRLDDWRNLPAYQLERRADIFFSMYLKKIIENKFKDKNEDLIDEIIPEFPLKIADVKPNKESKHANSNKSCKIDYVALSAKDNIAYFIELKTDLNSVNEIQWKYLQEASGFKIDKLMKGIYDIVSATKSKEKYRNLENKINKMGMKLVERLQEEPINVNREIKIIYIAPSEKSFKKEIKQNATIITFTEIADLLDKENNRIATRFAESLRKWIQTSN